jgi:signal transduction histidine kinase
VLEVPVAEDTRLFEVSKSPFQSGDTPTGHLLTFTNVTDRESYKRQLEEKTEQLEALNRVVRHDIRNDMSVVLGWAELLKGHVDEDGEESLERVIRKSQHVIELTEVAREFVESLTNADSPELKSIALPRVLNAELTAIRESYPDAEFHVSGDIPQVSVEANEMLSSAFRNLFENAVRHNDEETPRVTISTTQTAETVLIRVADNGLGVPDQQKETIFGKGEKRVDSTGSGIGLYLVNMLLDQFGGDVWVEDNYPKGSVFVLELNIST